MVAGVRTITRPQQDVNLEISGIERLEQQDQQKYLNGVLPDGWHTLSQGDEQKELITDVYAKCRVAPSFKGNKQSIKFKSIGIQKKILIYFCNDWKL